MKFNLNSQNVSHPGYLQLYFQYYDKVAKFFSITGLNCRKACNSKYFGEQIYNIEDNFTFFKKGTMLDAIFENALQFFCPSP